MYCFLLDKHEFNSCTQQVPKTTILLAGSKKFKSCHKLRSHLVVFAILQWLSGIDRCDAALSVDNCNPKTIRVFFSDYDN